MVRTYFLYRIANNEEIQYSFYSSVISCFEMNATVFAEMRGKKT